jgi:Flp pilus assembly protein CpaB
MEVLKKNFGLVIAIILAIIASLSIYFTIKAMSPTIPVVVANQNLRVGTVITKEVLATKNYSANNIPPTAFTSTKDVIGKTVINGPVVTGDAIRTEHLSLEGSLMAALKTFAPEGWTAVELPAGAGAGLKGLKKGDQVDIYGEIGTAQGTVVSEIVKSAIVLSVPDIENNNPQYILAVPANYAKSIAEVMVRQKPITITLPSVPTDTVQTIPQGEEVEVKEE